jgi:hypothetical protein
MAITRSQLVKELEPGLNALFGLEYKRYENEHEAIFSIETSDRAFEEEVMLTGFGSAPEGALCPLFFWCIFLFRAFRCIRQSRLTTYRLMHLTCM